MQKRILAISGSTRRNSSNQMILNHIKETYKQTLDIDIYDEIDKLPHFNPDLDRDPAPEYVTAFRERIMQADGVLICTPEYVFSLPGSLKNAIEWTVSTTLFSNKPVALIVASASGKKALEALELIMTTIESRIAPGAKLLIQGAKGKVNKEGKITHPETIDGLKKLMNALIESVGETDGIPTKYARYNP